MKRVIKGLVLVLGTIVFLLAAFFLYITVFFNPNDYRDGIEKQIYKATGLELSGGVPIAWSFYPWLGFELLDVAATIPQGLTESQETQPFMKIHRVSLGISLKSLLLDGVVESNSLLIEKPEISLYVTPDGRSNWQQLKVFADQTAAATEQAEANQKAKEGLNLSSSMDNQDSSVIPTDNGFHHFQHQIRLNIKTVYIRNASLEYHDYRPNGQKISILDVSFDAHEVAFGQFFPIDFALSLKVGDPTQLYTEFAGTASVRFEVKNPYLEIIDLALDNYGEMKQKKTEWNTSINSHLVLNFAQKYYNVETLMADVTLKNSLFEGSNFLFRLRSKAQLNQNTHQLSLSSFNAKAEAGLEVEGQAKISALNQEPQITGTFKSSMFNLRDVLVELGFPNSITLDPQAMSQAQFQLDLDGPIDQMGIKTFAVKLDETQINGNAFIEQNKGLTDFNILIDSINLDRYLPPPKPAPVQPPNPNLLNQNDQQKLDNQNVSSHVVENAEPSSQVAKELDSEYSAFFDEPFFKTLKLEGKLSINSLIYQGLDFQKVYLATTANNGLIKLDYAKADLYEGSVLANAKVNLRKKPASLNAHVEVSRVALKPIMEKTLNSSVLTGNLHASAKVKSQGMSWSSMEENLKGETNFSIEQGALAYNLLKPVCEGLAQLNNESVSGNQWPPLSPFQAFNGHFKIEQGIVDNDDLHIKLADHYIDGSGVYHLKNHMFDYKAALIVTGNTDQQACQIDPKYQKVPWPIRCQGTMDESKNIQCGPDLESMRKTLAELVKVELRNQTKKALQEKLQHQLGSKLDLLPEIRSKDVSKELEDLAKEKAKALLEERLKQEN